MTSNGETSSAIVPSLPPGVAPIKAEYRLPSTRLRPPTDDDAAESHTGPVKRPATTEEPQDIDGTEEGSTGPTASTEEGGSGAAKLKGAARKRARKEEAAAKKAADKEKAKASGSGGSQNKNRKFALVHDEFTICHARSLGKECAAGDR